MRRTPMVVAIALLVAGLAVMLPGWLLDERDYLAVTPQPPAVEQPTHVDVPPKGRICMDRVALDPHSEVATVRPVGRGRAVPLELTIEGEGGYVARGRAAAHYRAGDVVPLPVDPPRRSLIATLCVHNRGSGVVSLAAVQDRRRSRSIVRVNDAEILASFVIQFAEREPVSILDRLPVSLERMTVLRPAVVSEATLWPLLVLFVAGIPAMALWGFSRAVRDDEDGAG